jgi:outer membrane protein assembly factor BamE (lipoprotein component of BamABCDE complex)
MKNIPMKWNLMILACCLTLMAGCASYGNKMDRSKLDQIKKGVTTRAEVEALFGPPMTTALMGWETHDGL